MILAKLKRPQQALLTVALLVIAWMPAFGAYPNYLSYFNFIAGSPSRAHHYLLDSNLDWGQDVKLLGEYLQKHEIRKINLSLFASADPRYYGILECIDIGSHATRLPGYESGRPDLSLPTPWRKRA